MRKLLIKKNIFFLFPLFYLFVFCHINCLASTSVEILYKSIDQKSLPKLLAFYDLYSETEYGKLVKKQILKILHQQNTNSDDSFAFPSKISFDFLLNLVNPVNNSNQKSQKNISKKDLKVLQKLASNLHNRKLLGHNIWKKEKLQELDVKDIDLGRSIFLSQDITDKYEILKYETQLDLMTLQIIAQLPDNPTDIEKIKAINKFIFYTKYCYTIPQLL